MTNQTAVPYLANLKSLEILTVSDTALTDSGFQQLLKLPKLNLIHVDNTKVTKEAVEKAKTAYPKINISN